MLGRFWDQFASGPATVATLLIMIMGASSPTQAALITDVADAADTIQIGETVRDDPFDAYFGAELDFVWHQGKITREPINSPGVTIPDCDPSNFRLCGPVDELRWSRAIQRVNIKIEIGLFHDLSITVNIPITIGDLLEFRYADDVGSQNSTIDDGTPNRLFANDSKFKHSGVGAVEVGFRFGPLSDERDDSKPNWVIYGWWGIPFSATMYDPEDRLTTPALATESSPAPMGDGVHRLTIGTALSRRIGNFGLIGIDTAADRRGYVDPYFAFDYTVPFPTGSHSPRALVYSPPADPPDYYGYFGTQPSHIARVFAGMEIVPYESLQHGHKFAVDISFRGAFHSEGRNYSEISDALRELTYTEQFFEMGGQVGFNLAVATYLRFYVGVGLFYVSEHFLTYENVGKDCGDAACSDDVLGDGQVLPGSDDYLNPYFCGNDPNGADNCSGGQPSYDQIGFRLKSEEQMVIRINTGLFVTF